MPSVRTAPVSRRAAPLPPHERRAAIVAAVIPLLIEQGAGVTSRQLAGAAGVSEGTIFNVFADKDELIAAAVAAAIDQAPYERAISAIDPDAPFAERLIAATALTQRRIVDIWRLVSQLGPHHHPEQRPLPDSEALAQLLANGAEFLRVEPVRGARLLRALTLSMTHPVLVAHPSSAAEIVDVFLHGVLSPDADGARA